MSVDSPLASAQQIQWHEDLTEAKAKARDTNRLVWLHFTADWCVPCKRLNSFVFTSTGVIRAADLNTVAVKIDADAQATLVKQLSVPRIPYDIVMTPSGRVIVSRPSPKNTSDFLKMFNRLDRPLQQLSSGDREVIDANLDKLHGIMEQSGGLNQQKSDLDLEGPSHQMAATTVEGQRLERGFESSSRAAEIRSVKANLLKQQAEAFIAEEQKRLNIGQGPKISENPFFKSAGSPNISPNAGIKSPGFTTGSPKTVSNAFVTQQNNSAEQQAVKDDSAFVLPTLPAFGEKAAEKVAVTASDDLTSYEERNEFSFSPSSGDKVSSSIQKTVAKPGLNLDAPAFTPPKFAGTKRALPELPDFKDRSAKKADSNEFAYAPINDLRKALRSESNPNPMHKTPAASNSFKNPINESFRAKSATVQQRPAVKRPAATFAEFEQPTMQTDFSVPQAPAMMEGVVKIAKSTVPAIEGRLVAAEQPIDDGTDGTGQSVDTIQKQLSRTDRLLESVNFFDQNDDSVQSAPRTFAVPSQPVPQSQIVINLNTGNVANQQQNQPASQAVVIQPNFAVQTAAPSQGNLANQIALASSASSVGNRATISKAETTSSSIEIRSQGKVPGDVVIRRALGRREQQNRLCSP